MLVCRSVAFIFKPQLMHSKSIQLAVVKTHSFFSSFIIFYSHVLVKSIDISIRPSQPYCGLNGQFGSLSSQGSSGGGSGGGGGHPAPEQYTSIISPGNIYCKQLSGEGENDGVIVGVCVFVGVGSGVGVIVGVIEAEGSGV